MRKVLFILGQLSDDDVDWLAVAGHTEHAPAGVVLVQQGKHFDSLYFVLEGLLAVTRHTGQDGQELAQLGAGEIIGEMSFITAGSAAATVTTLEDSVVLAIPKVQLSAKLEQDTEFAAHFYRAIAGFLSDRLPTTLARLGQNSSSSLSGEIGEADELDATVLDNIHLAGARFERLLKQSMAH
jgi:bacteriocin-type transport-associated protein